MTIAVANTAGIPGNAVMISPSATAPTVTDTRRQRPRVPHDVVPDAVQGVKMAKLLLSKGIKDIGITYVNNDYGKGLADAFAAAYTAAWRHGRGQRRA